MFLPAAILGNLNFAPGRKRRLSRAKELCFCNYPERYIAASTRILSLGYARSKIFGHTELYWPPDPAVPYCSCKVASPLWLQTHQSVDLLSIWTEEFTVHAIGGWLGLQAHLLLGTARDRRRSIAFWVLEPLGSSTVIQSACLELDRWTSTFECPLEAPRLSFIHYSVTASDRYN